VGGYVAAATAAVVGLAAVAMYDVEHDAADANITSLPDALWWAATTVTTVGYGDHYPTTGAGRLVAVALMLTGIALLGVITASIAAWFVDRLHHIQQADEHTDATLTEVLTELRALHARLDALDERGPAR
jgi:voltage-gated potassium channel